MTALQRLQSQVERSKPGIAAVLPSMDQSVAATLHALESPSGRVLRILAFRGTHLFYRIRRVNDETIQPCDYWHRDGSDGRRDACAGCRMECCGD